MCKPLGILQLCTNVRGRYLGLGKSLFSRIPPDIPSENFLSWEKLFALIKLLNGWGTPRTMSEESFWNL